MPKQTFFNLAREKQQLIMDCAIDEFSGNGYKNASISRIVAASGIAKGSFYQYFADKEDLYGYVIDSIVRREMLISDKESSKLEDLNLTSFLRDLLISIMREFSANPKLMKISVDFWRWQSEPVQKRIYEKYENIQDNYFQQFISLEKSRGKIDPGVDDDTLAYMLTGISYHIIGYMLASGYESVTEEYINDLVDKIEYILTNGIYSNTIKK